MQQEKLGELENIIQEGIRIQMLTWKSPLTDLKNSHKSKGQPEFLRTLETDWMYFNSATAKEKFYNHKIVATIEQQKIALLTLDLLNIASKRWQQGKPKATIKAIIGLYCMHKDDKSFGWRSIALALRKMGIKMSHPTAKRYYDRAMSELLYALKNVESL